MHSEKKAIHEQADQDDPQCSSCLAITHQVHAWSENSLAIELAANLGVYLWPVSDHAN